MRKLATYLALVATVLGAGIALHGVASAAWGNQNQGYFSAGSDGGSDYTKVIKNAGDPANPGLYPILGASHEATPTKDAFIAYIEGKLGGRTQYAGSTQDEIGAAFIIQSMRGITGHQAPWPSSGDITDWENRIRNPAISLGIQVGYNITGDNSGYSPSMNDDAWIIQAETFDVLYFKDASGNMLYRMKTNCANALGDVGLPTYTQTTGSIAGINVDSTSGGNLGGGFKPSISVNPPNEPAQPTNPFYFTALPAGGPGGTTSTYTTYTVTAPASYTDNAGVTYTLDRYTFCDSTDHPGCDNRLTTSGPSTCNPPGGQPCDVIYGTGTTTVQIHLKINHAINMRWFWKSGGVPGPSTGDCPPFPNYKNVLETLSPQNVPASSVPAYSWGGTYYNNTPTNTYTINSAADQYGQGVSWTPTGEHPNSFTLDYSNYVNSYPYDSHQTTINYTTYYDQQVYSAKGYLPVYNDYDTCDYYTTGSYDVTYYYWDGTQWVPYTVTYYYTYCGNWTHHHDLIGYSVTLDSTNKHLSAAGTTTATTLPECFNRTFTVQPSGSGNATFDNDERPTSATITDPITVTFDYDGPAPHVVRNPMVVNGISLGPSSLIVRRSNPDGTTTDFNYPYPSPMSANYPSSYNGSTSAGATYPASIPQLQYGDQICFILTASPGAGDMDENGNIKSTTVSSNSDNGPIEPICSEHLAAKPYLHVYGGDVEAGSGIATAGVCTASPATVNTWNRGAFAAYAGSGVQFALQAAGTVNGFASDIGNNGNPGAGPPPTGLTYANNSGALFGGSFGSPTAACGVDYVDNLPPGTNTYTTSQTFSHIHLAPGTHRTDFVNLSGANPNQGVYITSTPAGDGVVYDGANGWTRLSDIQTYKLIVYGGNIYIDPKVTELDGLFVALAKSGVGGNIYTCGVSSGGNFTEMDPSQLFSGCDNELVINGAFVANNVKFDRTRGQGGTDVDATNNEIPKQINGAGNTGITGPGQDSHAAEVFVYSPEMWLAEPPANLSNEYDSITSLPPIL